jgi:hypothetical protein
MISYASKECVDVVMTIPANRNLHGTLYAIMRYKHEHDKSYTVYIAENSIESLDHLTDTSNRVDENTIIGREFCAQVMLHEAVKLSPYSARYLYSKCVVIVHDNNKSGW